MIKRDSWTTKEKITAVCQAAMDDSPVSGFTHTYYRYPARFSPQFARTAIEALTKPGDLVLEYRYENGLWQQPIYAVRLKNNTSEKLYCAVLGLWEDFAIDVPYFPAGGIWLGPEEEVTSQLMYASVPVAWWEAGVTQCGDVLKLIAASAEFDATLLVQSALDRPRRSVRPRAWAAARGGQLERNLVPKGRVDRAPDQRCAHARPYLYPRRVLNQMPGKRHSLPHRVRCARRVKTW